jgi:cytochrome b involved in lipid metabolism
MISCIQNIFKESDYNNNTIKKNIFLKHNTKENAWIKIDNNVYSIRQDDTFLLELFKEFYGKDVKDLINNNTDTKQKIIILELLKKRKIGIIVK